MDGSTSISDLPTLNCFLKTYFGKSMAQNYPTYIQFGHIMSKLLFFCITSESQTYLVYILGIYWVYLLDIRNISSYLSYISGLSHMYISGIFHISEAHNKYISGIYLKHILDISLTLLTYISGIFPVKIIYFDIVLFFIDTFRSLLLM